MNRARIYLDVDGVINAQMPLGWGRLQNGHAKSDGTEFRIRWAPRMLEALAKVDADIVWCTTWRDDATASLADLLGFGREFRVLHPLDGVTTYPSIYWKMEAIGADQKRAPSQFVWVDDEHDPAHVEYASDSGGLTITPNAVMGIKPEDIATIAEFLA